MLTDSICVCSAFSHGAFFAIAVLDSAVRHWEPSFTSNLKPTDLPSLIDTMRIPSFSISISADVVSQIATATNWQGGMSFHGGFIGVILATILFTRDKAMPLLQVADAVELAAPVGLLLGRLSNFINAELYGRPTDVPWAMRFPTQNPETGARDWTQLTEPRHPYARGDSEPN